MAPSIPITIAIFSRPMQWAIDILLPWRKCFNIPYWLKIFLTNVRKRHILKSYLIPTQESAWFGWLSFFSEKISSVLATMLTTWRPPNLQWGVFKGVMLLTANNQVMDGKEVVELVSEHNWVRVSTDAGKKLANCLSLFFIFCHDTQIWIQRAKKYHRRWS